MRLVHGRIAPVLPLASGNRWPILIIVRHSTRLVLSPKLTAAFAKKMLAAGTGPAIEEDHHGTTTGKETGSAQK
ncbi:MAG TPA: hypothetical protein VM659_09120 [Dongiaceae bacterium]|nr:hypothetical protein [Dongiaceae bacterium]